MTICTIMKKPPRFKTPHMSPWFSSPQWAQVLTPKTHPSPAHPARPPLGNIWPPGHLLGCITIWWAFHTCPFSCFPVLSFYEQPFIDFFFPSAISTFEALALLQESYCQLKWSLAQNFELGNCRLYPHNSKKFRRIIHGSGLGFIFLLKA